MEKDVEVPEQGPEVRFTETTYGETILDEIVGTGSLHTKDLGQGIMVYLDGDGWHICATVVVQRMPMRLWMEELRDAWYERRWPCFWVARQILVETDGPVERTEP